MLVVAGRYRDFPLDYFLLPVCGFAVLRLLGVWLGGSGERGAALLALGAAFTRRPQPEGTAAGGSFLVEAALLFLLLALPALVLLIETLAHRGADRREESRGRAG